MSGLSFLSIVLHFSSAVDARLLRVEIFSLATSVKTANVFSGHTKDEVSRSDPSSIVATCDCKVDVVHAS